ncbi:hypothetical protein [Haloarcula sp. 1CSR25-25]|uniref:hypothetical protein n=1 Tax=Haloarcula sp. 1CSR25-25 TaxID=2862545 RepID=UPI0028946C18|nr:hypothetical protein [Haloarcula sp. 1CSR25-25]MDT3437882.1 hypothetical protein [Haloarcula sp. 1CSR25-25]
MPDQGQQISDSKSADNAAHAIDFSHINVLVVDEETTNPVPGAEVTFTPLDSEDDAEATAATAETEEFQGVVEFKLAPRVRTGKITVSHDPYKTVNEKLDIQDGETEALVELELGTGTAHLGCDDVFLGSLSTTLSPADEFLEERHETDADVTIPAEGLTELELTSGSYTVAIDDPELEQYFESFSIEFTVTEEEATSVTFELDTEYQLSADQETQLDSLRDSITTLRSTINVDTAVQYYLSSVTMEAIREFESCISEGTVPLGSDVSPEKAQSAMLHAIHRSHLLLEMVLKGKQAVDLFTACNEKVDLQIEWNGEVDVEAWSHWLCQDTSWAEDELQEAKEETSDIISEEASDLAEVGPLYELLDKFELPADAEEIEYISQAYILTCYLEAVARLFDYPDLKDRFDETPS